MTMQKFNSISDFENYDFDGDLIQFRATDGYARGVPDGHMYPFLDKVLGRYRDLENGFNDLIGAMAKNDVVSESVKIHAFRDKLALATDAARETDKAMQVQRHHKWIRAVVHATPGIGPFLLKKPGEDVREVTPETLSSLIQQRNIGAADLIFRSGWKEDWRTYPKAFRSIAKSYLGAPPLPVEQVPRNTARSPKM